MDHIKKLCFKEHLDTSDTLALLRYLQDEATPFLPLLTPTSNQTKCASTTIVESKRAHISGSHRREVGVARSKGEWPSEGTPDRRRVKPITSHSQREPLDLTNINEFPPIAATSNGK